MLDTTPILWLQEWQSPLLTDAMAAVSFWGSAASALAVAVLVACGRRPKLGVSLMLAIVFADVMATAAKDVFELPRPYAADSRIRALGASPSSPPDDSFGFPSGHVAITVSWAAGLAWWTRKRFDIGAAAAWIGAMAISRMYLGRHFPADVVGGLVVGLAALALARRTLPPEPPDGRAEPGRPQAWIGAAIGAGAIAVSLAGAGLELHQAGRVCGVLAAALLLDRARVLTGDATPARRVARAATALGLLGLATWSAGWTWMVASGTLAARAGAVAAGAALHASVLLVPVFAFRSRRHRP